MMKKSGPSRVVVMTEWVSRKLAAESEREVPFASEVKISRELPAEESWLYEVGDALAMVARGLRQASLGVFADYPPDLEGDTALVAQIDK
jgi:hypothetical protein